jgi:hypothetical protein
MNKTDIVDRPDQNTGKPWSEMEPLRTRRIAHFNRVNLRSPARLLTPEERARITELQDVLIERFVEHAEALADGQEARAEELRAKIDGLLREKEEVEKWAVVGSA